MTGWIVCSLAIAVPGWILGQYIHHHSPATTNGDGAPSCPKEGHMRQQFTMLIPQEFTITNNRASPIWLRRKVKDGISALTRAHAANLYPVGKASIYVGITKRTRGAYDPVNLSDSLKPAVDTLVKMGVLDEDDYHHVMGPFLWHAGVDKKIPARHMRATVTLTDYSTTPF